MAIVTKPRFRPSVSTAKSRYFNNLRLPHQTHTPGDTLIVQITADGLTVCDGLRAIGRIENPAPEMMAAIRDCGGYADGVLQRVGLFGDTVEVSVK